MAGQAYIVSFIVIVVMVKTDFYETSCLGGYQDSSVVYQFQSRKILNLSVLLKLLFPVIFMNLCLISDCCADSVLSLNIMLQRNSMHINKVPYRRILASGTCVNLIMLCNQTCLLSFACVSLWVFFLILLAGDIESNPGPDMLDHSSDDNISNSSTYDISIFEQNFSIVQYNVQKR